MARKLVGEPLWFASQAFKGLLKSGYFGVQKLAFAILLNTNILNPNYLSFTF